MTTPTMELRLEMLIRLLGLDNLISVNTKSELINHINAFRESIYYDYNNVPLVSGSILTTNGDSEKIATLNWSIQNENIEERDNYENYLTHEYAGNKIYNVRSEMLDLPQLPTVTDELVSNILTTLRAE